MANTIGILIPTYNRVELLKRCLDSIFNQTYQDFIIYICDDGSVDNTFEEILKLKNEKIALLGNKENKGVAYARNMLLEMCSADIACWQDDDDLMNKYRLENQYNILKQNPESYVIGNCQIFRDEKEIESDINERVIASANKQMGFASMMIYNKNLPEFNEDLKTGEDTEWMKKLKLKRIEIDYITYYIRYHSKRLGMKK